MFSVDEATSKHKSEISVGGALASTTTTSVTVRAS